MRGHKLEIFLDLIVQNWFENAAINAGDWQNFQGAPNAARSGHGQNHLVFLAMNMGTRSLRHHRHSEFIMA
jgi:hypothetical protein